MTCGPGVELWLRRQQLSMAYDRKQIILERGEVADKLPGQYVEVYDFADRPLEVRWKGHYLPYRVFSKDQRVSHTATVENKRLSRNRNSAARAIVSECFRPRYAPAFFASSIPSRCLSRISSRSNCAKAPITLSSRFAR